MFSLFPTVGDCCCSWGSPKTLRSTENICSGLVLMSSSFPKTSCLGFQKRCSSRNRTVWSLVVPVAFESSIYSSFEGSAPSAGLPFNLSNVRERVTYGYTPHDLFVPLNRSALNLDLFHSSVTFLVLPSLLPCFQMPFELPDFSQRVPINLCNSTMLELQRLNNVVMVRSTPLFNRSYSTGAVA